MNKFIITFGSGQLENYAVNPMEIALIVKANNENEARQKIINTDIGTNFCTSYPYETFIHDFKNKYNMYEITLDDLMNLKI